jgi:hypothetical protein
LLADLLIAIELFAYSDEMMNEPTFPFIPRRSPLKQFHPLVPFFLNVNLWLYLIAGGIIFGLNRIGVLGDGWARTGYLICVFMFVITLILATVSLPFAWRTHAKGVKQVRGLIGEMNDCYLELRSDGPVSAVVFMSE